MNTRSDPASLELNAINALFQEIWAMQRKKRQVSPRGAESILEEIAETAWSGASQPARSRWRCCRPMGLKWP
jgi:hypothetical protein